MSEEYRGFKIVASDTESIANYNFKFVGVWVGCPNPEKYLDPKPKITKKDGETFIDASDLVNTILEIPSFPEGMVARISFLFL